MASGEATLFEVAAELQAKVVVLGYSGRAYCGAYGDTSGTGVCQHC